MKPVRLPVRTTVLGPAALLLSGLLAGCSGLGGGSSLTCKLPDGARCDSVSNTYSESTRGELPGQRKRNAYEGAPAAPSGTSQRGEGGQLYADPRFTQMGMPLRSQPRIVRVWIKPWEDSDGDLHDQTFVYLPVDEGKWMVDHKQREVREAYAPARASARSAAAATVGAAQPLPAAFLKPASPAPAAGRPTERLSEAVQNAQKARPAPVSNPAKNQGGNSGS